MRRHAIPRRNFVYAAVMRGKQLVVVVGKALAIAVRGAQTRRRWSKLKDWPGGERGNGPAASKDILR